MLLSGILFAATYVLLLALPSHRTAVALCGGAAFLACGILTPQQALAAVDWNVLLMLAGTMGLVSLFIQSGMPAHMADQLLAHIKSVRTAVVMLAVFAGLISAFIDNVATVLMVAPVAMAVAKKLKVSPVPVLIAIAVSSNLQGAATLVGDTTSILLGGAANLDFLDFFWYQGRPGIFWVVELGAALSAVVLAVLFRNMRGTVEAVDPAPVKDYFPSVLMVAMILLLAGASFLPVRPPLINGTICLGLFLLGLLYAWIRRDPVAVPKSLEEIDFLTLGLLAGIFVVVGGVQESGLLDALSALFVRLGQGNLLAIYSLVVWGSVICSAFVDNIPYVAAMLPVVSGMAQTLGVEPTLLYFGLLIGATLGGNLTPVGASANIAAIGILRREGYTVRNRDFFRIGMPFTLCAVCTGYLMLWLLWA
jgi:Na+/H+ antiporter NhaD/arsenite permease-like protein